MSPQIQKDQRDTAVRLMAVEMISDLLASTDVRDLGRRLTEELRELTGARTAMLFVHRGAPGAHELLHACPERRAGLFPPSEAGVLCPGDIAEPLSCRTEEMAPDLPLRAVLSRAGVESLLRFPLRTGGEQVGVLLLLDLPALDRIHEAAEIILLLSSPIAMALRNTLAMEEIEQQRREIEGYARELELHVAERTAELAAANRDLSSSRAAALNIMEDAVEARDQAERVNATLRREMEERKKAEEALRESEGHYRSLFENMLNGFAYCRMIYDEKGRPEDFVYLKVNAAFGELTGLGNVEGKRVTEVIPGIREADVALFEVYGRVAATGEPERFEVKVAALDMWFWISVYSPAKGDFVAVFDVITERKRAEEALRESEERFRSLVEQAGDGFELMDAEGRYVDANDATCRQLGYSKEELLSLNVMAIDPLVRPERYAATFRSLVGGSPIMFESVHRRKDGTEFPVEVTTSVISIGGVLRALSLVRDITERKRAEEEREHLRSQLAQAQKMESVGTLAGGIAHDFNNILSAIIGYGHVALMKTAQDDPRRENIESMLEAADRAAHLTKDLLLFSRKRMSERMPVDLNRVVGKVSKFLKRVIGEDITCETTLYGTPIPVLADSQQMEQVLMNLATNARDAMPRGGAFTVRTEQVHLNESFAAAHGFGKPGAYGMITASDTGDGMDEETRTRIFEPFFTTKEVGKGTGLGLAAVYGIIKQHDGFINVYSEPGGGTTFRIYLPIVAAAGKEAKAPREEPPGRGTETILLAEDDPLVRKIMTTWLSEFGYAVIESVDGEDAVKTFGEHKDDIRLLLFDLIMPRMNGKEAYDEIRKIKPGVKVIFASGYAPDVLHQKVAVEGGVSLIYKPFSPLELLRKVRSTLDGAK